MVTVAGCLLLSEAVANCSKLIYVNLGSCIPTSEAGNCEELGVAIANFTKTSKTFALAEFIFAQNSIIGIPIIRWESLNKDINQHLSKLNLSNCMLGSAACNPLSRIIQKCVKLTYLNLRWNKFNADAISQIIDILNTPEMKYNSTFIKICYLTNNKMIDAFVIESENGYLESTSKIDENKT